MEEIKPVHRPSWLPLESFNQLLERYAPLPACQHCGSAEDLTVDHIVPRWAGGEDAVSNLQILCRPCNSTKGIREDSYWKQPFYWDFPPDDEGSSRLREAHRVLFNDITDSRKDFFGRSISDIVRHLYVNAWVVGSGKTLGIPVAAWALNKVIRAKWGGAARRVDRILVITKDQAIRDQIAHSIAHDLVKFKITARAPSVGIVTESAQFKQRAWLDSKDIIVTCEHMLWAVEGRPRPDLAKILAYFPMIAFDEPHYATDQITQIVQAADSSICFGFTGTPVNGCGELLQHMVLLTVYDYAEANSNDRSLKYVDANPDHFDWFVRTIRLDEGSILESGCVSSTKDPHKPGYSIQVEAARAVVASCLEEGRTRDNMKVTHEPAAPHRRQPDVDVALLYPVHILVFFDNIATAEELCAHFNKYLNENRRMFPEDRGWKVEVVHAGSKGKGPYGTPKRLARRPGDKPHPWMYSYKKDGKLDKYCARVLFVVDMAREGVNNPYCGIVGVACRSESQLDSVQGWDGRQLRGVQERHGRRLRVPPAASDMVRLITHETFRVESVIQKSFKFICNMRDELDGLPWVEDLDATYPKSVVDIQRDLSVSLKDKLKIAGEVEDIEAAGEKVNVDDLIRDGDYAPPGSSRADRFKEWIGKYQNDPESARTDLRLRDKIKATFILTREQLRHVPADQDIERHIRVHEPFFVEDLPVSDANRDRLSRLHELYVGQFQTPPLTSTAHINELCRTLVAGPVIGALGRRLEAPVGEVFPLAVTAVKKKLGVPPGTKLKDDGDYDIPQAHAIIRRPEVQVELTGWVIGRLIDKGLCPSFDRLRSPGAAADAE